MVESISKNFSFKEFNQDSDGTVSIGRLRGIPNINAPQPPGNISTWFLETRAKNGSLFKELFEKAVDHIIQYRQRYLPDDPELFFKLTDLIYDRFHVHFYQDGKADDIHNYRFLLIRTIFFLKDYGPTFIENYAWKCEGRT